ncbi:MAG: carbohydrate-binding domain-containing protein [Clostridia bacterium]|nr:carbohydrate-binding domain-containing protein [Clostridia bacterium]
MKKTIFGRILILLLSAALVLAAAGCRQTDPTGQSVTPAGSTDSPDVTAASDDTISAKEVTGEFVITTADGRFTQNSTTYTLTAAGTYTLRGALEGQILVAAGKEDEVIIELSGTTISCSTDSPIKILSADKVEISAKKGTENVVKDERPAKTAEDSEQGGGAIWADADLKLKGTGTLVVTASYNNGIHTTKDLSIQKLSLKVTAVNAALKGSDSIKIKSGNIVAISTEGDGVKTSSTDLNKSGEARGDVVLTGGSLSVYAAGDGIQAAHSFIMKTDGEGSSPQLKIYTGAYSSYTADEAATDSYKGVKAESEIDISAGAVIISSFDDGLHANSGTVFDSGEVGYGSITISGGSVTIGVYSPEGMTGGGQTPPGFSGGQGTAPGGVPGSATGGDQSGQGGAPGSAPGGSAPGGHGGKGGNGGAPGGWGGWGGQKTVSGADGIHADGTLTISGGEVYVDSAYEGLEANRVLISGGSTTVTAMDDGVNATKGVSEPQVLITGGLLDVTVGCDGDFDGIDSNGTYEQTGGIVITRGPNAEMMAALDAERSVTITGGTLIVLGYSRVQTGSGIGSYDLSLHSIGEHSVTVGGKTVSFTNAYGYACTSCYSDAEVTGK